MTEAEKSRIVEKARRAGLSTGKYMRSAAQLFRLSEDDKIMEGMIDQVLKATERAERAIEDALEYVVASNERSLRWKCGEGCPEGRYRKNVGRHRQGDSQG